MSSNTNIYGLIKVAENDDKSLGDTLYSVLTSPAALGALGGSLTAGGLSYFLPPNGVKKSEKLKHALLMGLAGGGAGAAGGFLIDKLTGK